MSSLGASDAYLFRECIANLDSDMVDFLIKSACFDELDVQMLNFVLNRQNTRLLLERFVSRISLRSKPAAGFTAIMRFSKAICWKRATRIRFPYCTGRPPTIILIISCTPEQAGTPLIQRITNF